MKKLVMALLIAVLGLPHVGTRPVPVKGGVSANASGCMPMAELVAFVAEQTDYPLLRKCPRVRLATSAVLRSKIARLASSNGEEPVAAYLPLNMEILLSPEIGLTSPLGRSYLVHELVHAHQFAHGARSRAPCNGWLEGEAYRVQATYLKAQNLAEDAFAFQLLGLLQSACAHSYTFR